MRELTLTKPIEELGQHGFRVRLPDFPQGDHPENPTSSRLYLFEDGKQFGLPHVAGTSVMACGTGNYIHWDHTLLFSTTDNSNPNTNGRTYKIVWDDDLYFMERADYFYRALWDKVYDFGGDFSALKGKSLLEIGCGSQHGLCLIAAGFGLDVVACDRYATPWDESFHPSFIEFLIRKGADLWPGFDASPLTGALALKQFVQSPYTFYQVGAEDLESYVDRSFDYHCSQAAFEHFHDVSSVIRMLWATTKPGAVGSHAIDFRDHRDFSKPFEFLLMSDEAYDALCGDEKYIHGNRLRPLDFKALWENYGFQNVEMRKFGCHLDDRYLSDFIPRLRASGTRFANEPEETLRLLGVNFVVRKPS